MRNDPICSVVIPVHDRPQALQHAVRSALAQTVEELEIIVVDDASTLPVELDADLAGDPRLRIVTRGKNGGVSAAQNTGIRHATGRFVAFLHSDDIWMPQKVEHQVGHLRRAAAIAMESATIRVTDSGGKKVGPLVCDAGYDGILRREVRNLHIGGFLFDLQALRAVGGFDDRLRAYEDFDLIVRIMRSAHPCCSSELVARLNQKGAERLANSPWMPRARRYLLAKYENELLDRYGSLPRVWQDWALRDSVDLLKEGDISLGRRRVRSSIGSSPRRALHRGPLFLSTFLGGRAANIVANKHLRRLERQSRADVS